MTRPLISRSLARLAFVMLLSAALPPGAVPAGAASAPAGARPAEPSASQFKELTFRAIGPASMGGRISDFAVSEQQPATVFAATGTGGLFKSTNLGTTWSAVFEKEAVASIGAVAVWQKNPSIVWAGTGEANSRNSSSWGGGVYRSTDGGANWKCVGLEATACIGRIVCDPTDSNTVWVAALGRLWGENPERGVFRTRDGGRTWQQVLKVDARTGAVDLAMDPSNPRVLYAAMYARLRTPWSYSGSGESGGIWRSTDGGSTWRKLGNGLPKRTGRIGLDVWRKNPRVVYAVVESDEGGRLSEFEDASRSGGLFRSDDAGESWKRISPFAPRAFYFSQVRVQPDDSTRVYLLGTDLYWSDDGGVSFKAGGARNLHPDCHAMWIDPANGRHVLLGTDGGIFQSFDRIASWQFVDNLAIGEFYNVAFDLREPFYRIYGGLQDNQTWGGPSRTTFEAENFGGGATGGSGNDAWHLLGGGDGFHVAVDPTNPDLVWYESQGGQLVRQDLASGRERYCRPSNGEGEPVFRFNWNAPFLLSPHDPSVLWLGGQYVFRLTDRGERWERVSPDLTTADPAKMVSGGSGAETYCTIVSLAESPVKAGIVWAGTDDGKVWVTSNGGGTWTDLTANLRGVPRGLYVSRIEASPHDARTAFVSIDGHRSNVLAPYLFVTRDLGQSWTSLASDLPKDQPVKVVRQDPGNPSLLFAGTEFGLYLSFDGGRRWLPWRNGLPTVAVDDIQIHPRDRDLIVATHGRSLYVLDGIQLLEHWSPSALSDSVTFAPPRTAWAYYPRPLGGRWGQRNFLAPNPPFGAWFDYFLPHEIEGGVSIAVTDSAGRAVRTLTGPGGAGFHRVVWDLVAGEPRERIQRPEWSGQPQYAPAGRYRATLTAGKAAPRAQPFEVRGLPGVYKTGL
ncbi:MAG: hypothetical protein IT347_06350 [Candidatus Eisenbacteria bacterium]|nr:hypothetical protein [Candidatus Eisenbacteria bacterium]